MVRIIFAATAALFLLQAAAVAQQQPARYAAVLTQSKTIPATDPAALPGAAITLPAGTVVNVILWDGRAPYNPGPGVRLVKSDTLNIGDVAP